MGIFPSLHSSFPTEADAPYVCFRPSQLTCPLLLPCLSFDNMTMFCLPGWGFPAACATWKWGEWTLSERQEVLEKSAPYFSSPCGEAPPGRCYTDGAITCTQEGPGQQGILMLAWLPSLLCPPQPSLLLPGVCVCVCVCVCVSCLVMSDSLRPHGL